VQAGAVRLHAPPRFFKCLPDVIEELGLQPRNRSIGVATVGGLFAANLLPFTVPSIAFLFSVQQFLILRVLRVFG
jgi:hypothetical protein